MLERIMVTYKEYKNLGYSAVPKEQYARYADMAKSSVMKYTNRRFWRADKLSHENKRGFCEICDLYYCEINQTDRKLAGFSNDNYREHYFGEDRLSLNKRIYFTMQIFFTREQLCRGI